ncbi:hypothetical protein CANINC_001178 [Pichia inconspicua]|uniref:DUF1445 domain-containing protein n=1 Tax=Pichia inconspicua TaxID=52247 RepID=A0A4T0X4E7_9ASCO|nr:hypothetical protein CANINC_001178 [[Candida] inconspicua]
MVPKTTTPTEFRALCRSNQFTDNSSGYASGFAQANILILPKEIASDFELLCKRNPVPCPLLGKTILGSATQLSCDYLIKDDNFDLRKDLPKYRIFENGELLSEKADVLSEWDMSSHIGFLIGCSFSFENALCKAGLTPRNMVENKNVSMYQTKKHLDPAGIFTNTTYVVSMRPYKPEDIETVRDVTRAFTKTHGEPIDWGYEAIERLGICDINIPEYGEPISIHPGEIPVFWGCGVTTQVAALKVSCKIRGKIMSHSPGHMLILDIKDSELNRDISSL